MMYLKYIKYYYILLTAFALITLVTLGFIDFLPALVLMWIVYFIFSITVKSNMNKHFLDVKPRILDKHSYSKVSIIIMLYAIIFVPLYIRFYTGADLVSSIASFLSFNALDNESTYGSYQTYFEDANLKVFTFAKLPYIIGSGLLKFLYWALFIRTLAFKRNATFIEYLSVFVVTILYVFSGMARGTSFENFEIIMLVIYTALAREKLINHRNWFGSKSQYLITIFLLLAGFYFILSRSLRGTGELLEVSRVTNEMVYDPKAFISVYDQKLSLVLHSFNGYFLFGIYFSSVTINTIWLSSFKGFLSVLIPKGVYLFGIGESYNDIICTKVIDCGAAWSPDITKLFDNLGLILFVCLIVVVAKLSLRFYVRMLNGSIISTVLLYVIVLFFFSLPVGNFVTASSSIIIAIVLSILINNLKALKGVNKYFNS